MNTRYKVTYLCTPFVERFNSMDAATRAVREIFGSAVHVVDDTDDTGGAAYVYRDETAQGEAIAKIALTTE